MIDGHDLDHNLDLNIATLHISSQETIYVTLAKQVVSSIPHCVRPEWRLQK